MAELMSPDFWIGLAEIISVNVVLSGDNAVVIALAARSLPRALQRKAILFGSGGAVVLRVLLTLFAALLLQMSWLKLIGGALLLWIGVKLLVPESSDDGIESHGSVLAAVRTILIADLVMSLDNVIAVAGAARGSLVLLVLGLAISIPLVIFGSTLLLRLMERWPLIVTAGAALIGFVAGEMAVEDRAMDGWIHGVFFSGPSEATVAGLNLELLCGLLGAALVVSVGRLLAARQVPGTHLT